MTGDPELERRIEEYAELHRDELIEAYMKSQKSEGGPLIISESAIEELLVSWLVRDGILPKDVMDFEYGDKTFELREFECPEKHWRGRFHDGKCESYVVRRVLYCPVCFRELASQDIRRQRELELIAALPDIEAFEFVLTWELAGEERDHSLEWLIKFGDTVIHRQRAYYEDFHLFMIAAAALKEKYGSRIKDLIPADSDRVGFFLYGDDFGSIAKVKHAREALRSP